MSSKEFNPNEPTDSITICGNECKVEHTGRHYVLHLFGHYTKVCKSWWDILEIRDNLEGRAVSYDCYR